MNEISQLSNACHRARESGEGYALATVVRVEGSAYRRPGARMLITAGGQTTGLISGGCLDADVRERALQVIETGRPALVRYDTSKDEDVVWGLGLGCNGVVDVLIEPATEGISELLHALDEAATQQRRLVLVSVIRSDITHVALGASMLVSEEDVVFLRSPVMEGVAACMREDANAVLTSRVSSTAQYGPLGEVEAFFEMIEPRVPLLIFGAGADVLPLVEAARHVGWHTTIIDTQARAISAERFASADDVILCAPEDVASRVAITGSSNVVVMTHNYAHDMQLLPILLNSTARYVGCLGPRRRTERLLSTLGDERLAETGWARLQAPIGLDLGAENPAEIALSIIAEILATVKDRSGSPLRRVAGPIHGSGVPGDPGEQLARSASAAHMPAALTA